MSFAALLFMVSAAFISLSAGCNFFVKNNRQYFTINGFNTTTAQVSFIVYLKFNGVWKVQENVTLPEPCQSYCAKSNYIYSLPFYGHTAIYFEQTQPYEKRGVSDVLQIPNQPNLYQIYNPEDINFFKNVLISIYVNEEPISCENKDYVFKTQWIMSLAVTCSIINSPPSSNMECTYISIKIADYFFAAKNSSSVAYTYLKFNQNVYFDKITIDTKICGISQPEYNCYIIVNNADGPNTNKVPTPIIPKRIPMLRKCPFILNHLCVGNNKTNYDVWYGMVVPSI